MKTVGALGQFAIEFLGRSDPQGLDGVDTDILRGGRKECVLLVRGSRCRFPLPRPTASPNLLPPCKKKFAVCNSNLDKKIWTGRGRSRPAAEILDHTEGQRGSRLRIWRAANTLTNSESKNYGWSNYWVASIWATRTAQSMSGTITENTRKADTPRPSSTPR